MTAPQKPSAAHSTTRSRSAGTRGSSRWNWARQPLASTSVPYRSSMVGLPEEPAYRRRRETEASDAAPVKPCPLPTRTCRSVNRLSGGAASTAPRGGGSDARATDTRAHSGSLAAVLGRCARRVGDRPRHARGEPCARRGGRPVVLRGSGGRGAPAAAVGRDAGRPLGRLRRPVHQSRRGGSVGRARRPPTTGSARTSTCSRSRQRAASTSSPPTRPGP